MNLATPSAATLTADGSIPKPPSLPPNAFDFVPEISLILHKLFNDEIDPKAVNTEANAVRRKIQKARVLVAELPDAHKSLDELKAEAAELKERIKKQREMLKSMAAMEAVQEVVKKAEVGGQ